MKRLFTALLLAVASAACGRSADSAGALGGAFAEPIEHVPKGDPNALPKVPADPDKIAAMIRERFGDAVARNLFIDVEDQNGGKRVSLAGEVPNEEIRQGLIKELEARIPDMKSEDFTLELAGPARQVFTFSAYFHQNDSVLFSKDLTFCVTQRGNVYEIATGRRLNRIAFPSANTPDAMALSPDGKLLATSYGNATLILWDMPLGRNPRQLTKGTPTDLSRYHALTFTSDSKQLVTVNDNIGELTLWDIASGRSKTVGSHVAKDSARTAGQYFLLAVSPDNKLIATSGDSERKLWLWDVNARTRKELEKPRINPEAANFSGNGKILAVGRATDDPRGPALYDIASGKVTVLARDRDDNVAHLAFSPDDKTLAVTYQGEGLSLWDLATNTEWIHFDAGKFQPGPGLAFSPDGTLLAAACNLRPTQIRLWNVSQRPGAARATPRLPAPLNIPTVLDDALTTGIVRAISHTFDPRNTTNLKATLEPDGSITLTGQVSDEEVKRVAQRTAEIHHGTEDSGPQPPNKINNKLEVTGHLGPNTRPLDY